MANINRAIRFYQPNDPYYWQVDNLPLTDLLDNDIVLEERIAALEDSVNGLGDNCRGAFGVAAIADLKAYTEDIDGPTQNFGKVFVRPGKFTARMQIPATKETGWRMMRDFDDYFNNTSIDFGTGGLNTTTLTDDFVRYSRGTGRTSVVEFTSTFSEDKFVVIPSFDSSEFNSNSAPAERIDLIYITAHESLDTVDSDVGLKPTIGIIKGAYFRTDDAGGVQTNGPRFESSTTRRFGRITGMASTELTTGQTYGSLPSPDDLTNFAWHSTDYTSDPSYPEDWDILMQRQFETKAAFALPVAYVRVPQGYVQGQHIPCENVIDIRPFLRTTELTYSERAAIVASVGPSGKNPFVTDVRLRNIRDSLQTSINQIQGLAEEAVALATQTTVDISLLKPTVEQLKADVEGTASAPSNTSLNHEGRIAALENLLGQGINVPIESHKFLATPYQVFKERVSNLGSSTNPRTWNIPPIASYGLSEEDMQNIVAVQFCTIGRVPGSKDAANVGHLYMKSWGYAWREVNQWGCAEGAGDLKYNSASVNTFYAPVDSVSSAGTTTIRFQTYGTGAAGGDLSRETQFECFIYGYIVKEYVG